MKNSQLQIDFIFQSITFYPIEIPIFYKVIETVKSMYQDSSSEDFKKYLTYLESKFKPLFQSIRNGEISPVRMIFHIYELLYICILIDIYLIDNYLTAKEEKYLYEILDRFELFYYKYYPKIARFNLYPAKKRKYILREVQKEKARFFNVT